MTIFLSVNRQSVKYQSPYGDGSAAVYKDGKPEEIKFWTNQLNKCM